MSKGKRIENQILRIYISSFTSTPPNILNFSADILLLLRNRSKFKMARKNSVAVKTLSQKNRKSLDENIQDLVRNAITKWKAEYDGEVAALETEIQEIKASQEFVSKKYDSLKSNYDWLLATSKKQEEIQRLKTQSASLEVFVTNESKKVNALEQYDERLNLEIVGVPVKDNENTNDIVVEIAKLDNVEITKDQISTSQCLAAKPKRNAIDQAARSPPPIIVRSISRDIRDRLYANGQNLRNANSKHFSTDGTNHFYI